MRAEIFIFISIIWIAIVIQSHLVDGSLKPFLVERNGGVTKRFQELLFRGGSLKKSKKKKRKKTNLSKTKDIDVKAMLKAFFVSLYDPSCGGEIPIEEQSDSLESSGKENGLGASVFGSGNSFGPVCGPGGCH